MEVESREKRKISYDHRTFPIEYILPILSANTLSQSIPFIVCWSLGLMEVELVTGRGNCLEDVKYITRTHVWSYKHIHHNTNP